MPQISLTPEGSVLLIVDVQDSLLKSIYEQDRVVSRSAFLANVCALLGIPILATVQNPDRLGPIHDAFASLVTKTIPKMSFSCCDSDEFQVALALEGRRQVVVVGVETHICVGLTAQHLLSAGLSVAVCPDAVSASSQDRHKIGMERIRDTGIVPVHSEAVAYEWMRTADNPQFRALLKLVKQFQ